MKVFILAATFLAVLALLAPTASACNVSPELIKQDRECTAKCGSDRGECYDKCMNYGNGK